MSQQLNRLLIDFPVINVDKSRGAFQILQVDVIDDPSVNDDVILDVAHAQAAIDDLHDRKPKDRERLFSGFPK